MVLHPIEGVAGAACTIEHVDGTIEETRFPLLIDPVQPMTALRAITHEFLPGLKVTCRMEGDTFEMEDQRNWTDASYKTYVRPLALPWPYVIAKGETIDQTVTLTVSGAVSEIESVDSRLSLAVGEQIAGSCNAAARAWTRSERSGCHRAKPGCIETSRAVSSGLLLRSAPRT